MTLTEYTLTSKELTNMEKNANLFLKLKKKLEKYFNNNNFKNFT